MLDLKMTLLMMNTAHLKTAKAGETHCLCRTDMESDATVTLVRPVCHPGWCQGFQQMGRCTALWIAMVWFPWWVDLQL
uniref:Alternative protein SCN3A n=1 Tax=Homo sapiens TaxID=9606 RepID=L8E9G6_HUMAN|nr:alternative protein SCN3A [Homo sapiens]